LNSAPSSPPNIKILAIFCPSEFQDPQDGWTLWANSGRGRQVEKKYSRVSGRSVTDVTEQKSAFQDSWFSNNPSFCFEITNWAVQLLVWTLN